MEQNKTKQKIKTSKNSPHKKPTKKLIEKNSLNKKLDLIIQNQKKILENEKQILGEEQKIEKLEKEDLIQDKQANLSEKETMAELQKIESKLNKSIQKPLKLVTKRDIFKGFIGAFVGVIGHFAFSKAADIAKYINVTQATILYITAAFVITIMLYYTGFRNIEKQIILKFMPLRAIVLYTVSIITIIIVNLLFGKIHFPISFIEIYKIIGANIILAVMGAGTADLLGKVEGH